MNTLMSARRHAAALIKRFPALEVTIKRPARDEFREPTGEFETIGTVKCWRYSPNRARMSAEGITIANSATTHIDGSAVWLCMPIGETIEVEHGDAAEFDGRRYWITNIDNRGGLLCYWQINEEAIR